MDDTQKEEVRGRNMGHSVEKQGKRLLEKEVRQVRRVKHKRGYD